MSLDPHIAGAMQLLAEAGAKPLHEGTPEEGRAFYLATTAGALTPEQVVPWPACGTRPSAPPGH